MADGEPPDASPYSIGNYEQACDVRLNLKTEEHATDHSSDSTDTDSTVESAPGRPSIRLQFHQARWTIAAVGLCALVGVFTVAALSQFHQGDDNTEPILASIKNQLEANGKALQDILVNLKTSKLWGDLPGRYMPVPNVHPTTDTSTTFNRGTVDHGQPLTTITSILERHKTTQASIPSTGAALPTVAGYSAREGTCPGNNILSLYAEVTTLQVCSQRCASHPGCVAFAFADNHRCYPKTKTCDKTMKGRNVWNVFYDKKIDGPPPVNGYTIHHGLCNGNTIMSLYGTGVSLQDCAQRCDGRPDCFAFVHHHTVTGVCFPKSKPCSGSLYPMDIYYEKEAVCKIKRTDTIYHYRWDLPPLNTSRFRFEVKASNDIHVALSGLNQIGYEVVIGGWKNQKSVIRRRMRGMNRVAVDTPGIASPALFQTFEIHWAPDGTISVSKVPGTPFMTWRDPNPIPIHLVGYSTGWGSSGLWKFCSNGQVNTCPSGWTKLHPYCFLYVDNHATFDDAEKVCNNMGATLHTASDERGIRLMQDLAKNDTSRWIWTGGEPGQNLSPGKANEECMAIFVPKRTGGGRNQPQPPYMPMHSQRPCIRKTAFICKKG